MHDFKIVDMYFFHHAFFPNVSFKFIDKNKLIIVTCHVTTRCETLRFLN